MRRSGENDMGDAAALEVCAQSCLGALSGGLPVTPGSVEDSTFKHLFSFLVPFGGAGYVLRFDIRTPELVLVLGARHQREEDYH